MNVLVATAKTQGALPGDFFWTIEGEVLYFAAECDCPTDGPRSCGCKRALGGVTSHRSTTTFRIADLDMDESRFAEIIGDAYREDGFTFDDATTAEIAKELLEIATRFPVGTILERRRGIFQPRTMSAT